MAVPANVTTSANITAVREVDFVTQFDRDWQALRDIMSIMRPIKKAPGTVLKSKYAEVSLQSGAVAEGDEIPYSLSEVKEKTYGTISVQKYRKGVTLEAIEAHGYEAAIQLTDRQFRYELTSNVLTTFVDFIQTGTLTAATPTFQDALAQAQGIVINKWKKMKRGISQIVGFCNVRDAYQYLGAANITVQNQFGMNYIENFLGYSKLFLMSDNEIPKGVVIATPVENIVLYYIDPNDSDFVRSGLSYTVSGGETNLIGFHTEGNYGTATSESFAIIGMTLFAEYIDGIAVVDIGTESFAAVSSPAGNPSEKKYYEKDSNDEYFRTTDTTVVSGKTYYTRTVTAGA